MRHYILTERGRFTVAILIVSVLLIAVLIILAVLVSSQGSPDNSGAASPDVSVDSSVSLDVDAGTLTFLYAPSTQTSLDWHTITALGTLLASPKNSDGSMITVEIPQLPDDETLALTSMVIEALTAREVALERITFFVYTQEQEAQTYEVRVSFR